MKLQDLSSKEVFFLARDELLEIIPFFSSKELYFVEGTYGPFTPPRPASVPLWLAIELKRRARCQISLPEWMDVPRLEQWKREEELNKEEFTKLPFRYLEVSSALLALCGSEWKEAETVRLLLCEIREARRKKIAAGLRSCDGVPMNLAGMSLGELHEIRPLLSGGIGLLCELDQAGRAQLTSEKFSQQEETTQQDSFL